MPVPLFNITAGNLNVVVRSLHPKHQKLRVHGTSAEIESPVTGTEVFRRGWGTTIFGQNGELVWVHFSIPMPLIIDGTSPLLSKVFFFFRAGGGAQLRHVHVYDGGRRIAALDVIRDGDFRHNLVEGVNYVSVVRSIDYALGISVGFQFPNLTGGPPGGADSTVLLTGAGAEYETF